MDLMELDPEFFVSAQIGVEDVARLADEGFKTLICNRPAYESGADEQPDAIQTAAQAAGIAFYDNPLVMTELGIEHVQRQKMATKGKTLAYCASGTRSAILWAFSKAGQHPTSDILAALAAAGYPMDHLAPQIDALASRSG